MDHNQPELQTFLCVFLAGFVSARPAAADQRPDRLDGLFKRLQETKDAAWMIHDMALLNGGYPIANPKAHNKRLTKYLQAQMGLESLKLDPEVDPPVEEDEAPDMDMGAGGINLEDFQDMDSIDLDAMIDQMQAEQEL